MEAMDFGLTHLPSFIDTAWYKYIDAALEPEAFAEQMEANYSATADKYAEELTAWVKRLLDSRNAWRNYVNNLENQRVEDESEPDLQIVDTDADDDAVFLKKFRQEVDQQMAQGVKLDLDKIALSFRMGESQLKRKVRRLTGKSMANYITQLRMEKAMQLLKSCPDLRVGDVAEQCGFMDVAYFSRVFRQHYGMTPTVARNGE